MVFNPPDFPNLANEGFDYTSPVDNSYNCIAWAAGDKTRWWEPDSLDGYWPPIGLDERTVDCIVAAFQSLGYEECPTPEYEPDYERVAIFGKSDDDPTHAAKQIDEKLWSSKLGEFEDISHSLDGLVGDVYGMAMRFMRRLKR